jgi:glycosyltransferase involved in cell wall biosynthesis
MSNPEISVIIPAFNAERWLGATITSVLNQTHEDLELIVVNDGSTDRTQEVACSFLDPRIRYISREHRGLSAARNLGVLAARGTFIALLDADDLFKPDKLSRQIEAFQGRPELEAVTCGFEVIDDDGEVLREQLHWHEQPKLELPNLLFWNPLLPSTLVIRRRSFDKVGLFDETLNRLEDWEFAVRLAQGGNPIDYVRQVLVSYRRHQSNISNDVNLVSAATHAAERFMTRFFEQTDLPSAIRSLKPKVFGNIHLDAAARAYAAGLATQGRRSLEDAIWYDASLAEGDPPIWVTAICGYALGTLVAQPSDYLEIVASNLPTSASFQAWKKYRIRAQLEAAKAFRFRHQGSRFRARCSAIQAFLRDLTLMRNRGLWAIALKP